MEDINKYIDIIEDMRLLAIEANSTGGIEYLDSVLHLLRTNKPKKALEKIISYQFWGGPGSYLDQGFYVEHEKDGVDYRKNLLELNKLLLKLLRLLRSDGYIDSAYDLTEEILERGLGLK